MSEEARCRAQEMCQDLSGNCVMVDAPDRMPCTAQNCVAVRLLTAAHNAAIEKAAQTALAYRDEADARLHPDMADPDHSLGQGFAANKIAKRIRALKEPE